MLAWVIACKNKSPPPPTTAPSAPATVTYEQIGNPSWEAEVAAKAASGATANQGGQAATVATGGANLTALAEINRKFQAAKYDEAAQLAIDMLDSEGLDPVTEGALLELATWASAMAGDQAGVQRLGPRLKALIVAGGLASDVRYQLYGVLQTSYTAVGSHAEAVTVAAERRTFADAQFGKDAAETFEAHRAHATCLRRAGDAKQAKVEYESLLAVATALGGDDRMIALTHAGLGLTLVDLRKYKDAKQHFETAQTIHTGRKDSSPKELAYIYHGLGRAQAGLKETTQARTSLEIADALLDKALRTTPNDPFLEAMRTENDAALAAVR